MVKSECFFEVIALYHIYFIYSTINIFNFILAPLQDYLFFLIQKTCHQKLFRIYLQDLPLAAPSERMAITKKCRESQLKQFIFN